MRLAPDHCPTLGTTLFCPPPSPSDGDEGDWTSSPEIQEIGTLGCFAGHQLIKIIARGGMGIVYHARELETGEEVALKLLPGGNLLSKEARWRFAAEARTMAALAHPGILPVYGRGEMHGTPYFTMKLARGGSLAERKEHLRGQWSAIASLVAKIAEIVQFAHDHGVVHRDLKPSNIVFDDLDNPYVCDFGIAKRIDASSQLTRTLMQMGTPGYMSPELVKSSSEGPSTASDVWSLGVILYELLAGQRPFVGESPAQIMRHVEEDYPPPLRRVPRALAIIATTALSKRPADRYRSAAAMAADLQRWLRAEPILARPPKLTDIAWPWLRRHSRLATFAMLLTSFTLSGWSLLNRQPSDKTAERWSAEANSNPSSKAKAESSVPTRIAIPTRNVAQAEPAHRSNQPTPLHSQP